ncbi:hypothetical protein TNCV_1135881 [Trichonephila clavipes]|nr:hypothetical protein TNCV_1135881 [Trichonephila clavipes]
MVSMGCPVGREEQTYVQKRDELRLLRSEQRTSDALKQERINTRAEESALKKFQEEEKAVLYDQASLIRDKLRFS